MDPIIMYFIALIIGTLGFLLGFIVRVLTSRGTKSAKASGSKKPTKSKNAPRRSWIEVANLWRDRQDGGLIFQIENKYYRRGDELTNRDREILLKVVMDFYRWLEPSNESSLRSSVPEKPGMAQKSKPDEYRVIELPPSETSQGTYQENIPKPATEIQPPAGVTSSVFSSSISTPEIPTLSMVAQVDSILQEKLQAANMQKWAVRLTESTNKGMIVWVGMERYETIDEVPYERVRSIIRASVAEWERRSESGDIHL